MLKQGVTFHDGTPFDAAAIVANLEAHKASFLTAKALLQMEIYQPAREEAVLRHVRSVNPGPLDGDAMARLFERIIDEARRLERAMAERGHK